AAAREAAEPAPAEARVSAEPLAEQRPRRAARRAPAKKTAAAPDQVLAFSEALSGISGLGPARSADLAAHFGTVEALRQADVEQLAQVPGISQTLARRIRARLDEQQPAPAAPTATKATAKKAPARKTAAKRAPPSKAAAKAASSSAAARRGTARKAPVGDRQVARFQAALSGVSGLGPARIADLAGRFGTLRRLQTASTQEIAAVPGISETLARRIQQALQR
ncbi:MAG: helix-hairpin-helix domain-containing protein, partial [Actinomycetota bacterium]|nr:helix-hairpin-helix domain-containing protein [Actinomycetota bacterium]